MLSKMAALACSVAVAACSVVGVRNVEEPGYTVVAQLNGVEIRTYAARIAAETTIDNSTELDARSAGFRRIAAYIFGDNTMDCSVMVTMPMVPAGSQFIAMTMPVAQDGGENTWTIRFFMPAEYTLGTLPRPKDPLVRLVPVPAETVAVLRFTGGTDPATISARQADLRKVLRSTTYKSVGGAIACFYDPPWTLPPFRRNEVAVRIREIVT